jgi:hypothetical protein
MYSMSQIVQVRSVEVVDGHRLRLTFDDGAAGEVDASSWGFNRIFAPLADPEFFAKVELDEATGTIVWPNGADVAPDTLRTEALQP